MSDKIIQIEKITLPMKTESPFLVCMHHNDHYPNGNKNMGPDVDLSDRQIGQDFSGKDGFSMYHGEAVPGFPVHPHRGFETVTVVLDGTVDHFDSSGSEGRYGSGDVQWLTTGKGCQHAEMFPLVREDRDNPLELFQIWLNLPAKNKFVDPHFKMLWKKDIPDIEINENQKGKVKIKLIAGSFKGTESSAPAPKSWAASKENHVGIMLIEMDADSEVTVPAMSSTLNRNLYFYNGKGYLEVDGQKITSSNRIKLSGNESITISNGKHNSNLLLLEGEPINEPVAYGGPFVMNTSAEIQEAFSDYRKTRFGGWPWKETAPVHDRNTERFSKESN